MNIDREVAARVADNDSVIFGGNLLALAVTDILCGHGRNSGNSAIGWHKYGVGIIWCIHVRATNIHMVGWCYMAIAHGTEWANKRKLVHVHWCRSELNIALFTALAILLQEQAVVCVLCCLR